MVRVLIQYGADVNAAALSGETPLWVAARRGDMALAQLLVEEGADPVAPMTGQQPYPIPKHPYPYA